MAGNTADQSRETTTISPTILKNTGKRRLTISKTKVPIICGPGPGSPSHNFFDERKPDSEGATDIFIQMEKLRQEEELVRDIAKLCRRCPARFELGRTDT